MSAPVTFAAAKQFLGLARETLPGSAAAMTVTMPVEEFTPDQSFETLKDEAWRGSMAANHGTRQGVTKTEISLQGPAFGDTLGHLLLNLLGDLTTNNTGGGYEHEFSLLNSGDGQPPTHTFTHYQGPVSGTGARMVPGCCISDLTLKWSAESELFTLDAKGTGWGTRPADVAPVSAPSDVIPLAAWRCTIGIGGPAAGDTLIRNVSEIEVQIKRNLKPYYTASGSQDPYTIARGTVEVTGKCTFVATDEQPFLDFLNDVQPSLQILIGNGGTGAGLIQVQVDIPQASYSSSKFSGSNEAIEYENDWEAIATVGAAGASGGTSPIKITLSNGVASY